MSLIKVLDNTQSIEIKIPLTTTSGKIRVKNRSYFNEYGIPCATKQKPFSQTNYIEWQIGYDADITNEGKIKLTTLPTHIFKAYNGKNKALYELSEYLFYFTKWRLINLKDLEDLKNKILSIKKNELVENNSECQIKRTHPKEVIINNVDFYESKIEYPLLIHKFSKFEIISEITVREKQRAIGTQAMLYFCLPLSELEESGDLIGRCANTKETATFIFDKNNYLVILEMIHIFGMLSESHRADIVAIIDLIIKEVF